MPKVTLIIPFYNKLDKLNLVFAALERQTFRDFEVIIADDGSKKDVVNALNDLIRKTSFPVNHVWHEDVGWRKNVILNSAVRVAKADYLVFLDGDCVPSDTF